MPSIGYNSAVFPVPLSRSRSASSALHSKTSGPTCLTSRELYESGHKVPERKEAYVLALPFRGRRNQAYAAGNTLLGLRP